MIKMFCKTCSKEFYFYPCEKKRKFCSHKCYSLSMIGHISWSKLHPELMPRGKDNSNWKGGKYRTAQGYIYILKPRHPFCNNKGYITRSRFLVEKILRRYLTSTEQVHHINEIKDDDRIENFIVFVDNSAHKRFHHNPNNVKPSEIIFDGRKLTDNRQVLL